MSTLQGDEGNHIASRTSRISQTDEDSNEYQHADDFVDTVSAAMPPSMEQTRAKDVDELLKEMNRIPLFMTELDETDGEGGENVMLEAIKALAYEGTKAEVAANFREQGNEAAKAKLWTDAREFYSKAILTLQGKTKLTEADEDPSIKVAEIEDEAAEAKKERELEEACLTNRALCNLEMKNYGQCTKDCAASLRLNPHNIKAWYRAASACLSLDKIPSALDACQSGLKFDANNAALTTLQIKIESRRDYLAALESERKAREERQGKEQAVLRVALKARNIFIRETGQEPEMEDARVKLEDAEDATSRLAVPVLLLYPLHAQTDFVKAFGEGETLGEHLDYILPLPWDEAQEYRLEAVECYMETIQGGLIKAGKKLGLAKLLGSGKLEVVDGLVKVYVVPSARAQEWIEEFKKRRGKQ